MYGDEDSVSWVVVLAPLIGVVLLVGIGYLMGAIADWWRRNRD